MKAVEMFVQMCGPKKGLLEGAAIAIIDHRRRRGLTYFLAAFLGVFFFAAVFLAGFLAAGFFAGVFLAGFLACLLYTSPSPRDAHESRMPSSA